MNVGLLKKSANMVSRDRKIIRHTILGIALRLVAIAGTFLVMPIMLDRLGPTELGIWLVLLSVFQWITFFDLGVAAGARNEMARAFACREACRIRQAIATGLFYTVAVSSILAMSCVIVGLFTPAVTLLERVAFHGRSTGVAVWIVALGSCGAFVLNFIQMVYAAEQRASAVSYFSAVSNLLFLLLVYWWPLENLDRLNQISSLYLFSMAAANLSLVLWFFRGRSEIWPSVRDIQPEMRQRILGFGIRIFMIQIAAMVVLTTARALVSSFLEPADVVIYDAAFKLFAIITMLHSLLMTTFWSSFTEAHNLGDWTWLSSRVRQLQWLTLAVLLGSAVIAMLSPWIIQYWLTKDQVGSIGLYISFAILTTITTWSNVFAYFLNGIGDTKLQLWTSLLALAIHFPSCYLFTEILGLGLTGINLGTIVSLSLFAISGPIYVWRLLREGLLKSTTLSISSA